MRKNAESDQTVTLGGFLILCNIALELSKARIENKCIMIFAPCIPKISYLKDKNSKRELAGNSIEMEDWIVYDSKCFLSNCSYDK